MIVQNKKDEKKKTPFAVQETGFLNKWFNDGRRKAERKMVNAVMS